MFISPEEPDEEDELPPPPHPPVIRERETNMIKENRNNGKYLFTITNLHYKT